MNRYFENCKSYIRKYHPNARVELGVTMYAVFDGNRQLSKWRNDPEEAWISAYTLVSANQ